MAKRKKHIKDYSKRNYLSVWDSDIKFIDKIKIKIPLKLLLICNKIQEQIGNYEFSLLCKGNFDENGDFILSDDYKIVKQRVSASQIEYNQEHITELKQQGYNTVIHSHHELGLEDFSVTDDEYINKNFLCSILFVNKKFAKAIMNICIKDNLKLRVNCEIEIMFNYDEEIDTSNIEIYTLYNKDYSYLFFSDKNVNKRTQSKTKNR